MPTIKFTATPELPFDIAHLDYKAGDVVDLPEASCHRWIRRGVAEYAPSKELPQMVADSLRVDGPTVDEYVAAGYLAQNYPTVGYAPRSTDEEIVTAIAAQEANPAEPILNDEVPVTEPEALDPLPETDDARPEMPPPGRRGRPRK